MSSPAEAVADGGFTALFVEFCGELRAADLPVGSDDVMALCASLAELDPTDIMDTYWAGRCTVVSRRDHIPVYDDVFRRFFLDERIDGDDDPRITMRASTNAQGVLQVPDAEQSGSSDLDEDEFHLGLQASTIDVHRTKHFADCTPEELAALRRIMAAIRLTPPRRRSRRQTPAGSGRRLHIRRMVRETMRRHGEPDRSLYAERKLRPRPLILLLDVSGSMSDHSRNLLQFAYSTKRAAGRVEVFCFGTRITRITPQLDRRRPDEAMARAASAVFDWDGGTRIGDSITEFVRRWGRRGLARGGIVVICSDGLDRGDPETLERAMEQLSRLCHRVVWMNPHVGDRTGVVPNTLGMMIAEPYIDEVWSGHNLRSLEQFARALPALR
ncbi:MAG: vWA domain-containing protein [Ilumatobacteraceae bacterium]